MSYALLEFKGSGNCDNGPKSSPEQCRRFEGYLFTWEPSCGQRELGNKLIFWGFYEGKTSSLLWELPLTEIRSKEVQKATHMYERTSREAVKASSVMTSLMSTVKSSSVMRYRKGLREEKENSYWEMVGLVKSLCWLYSPTEMGSIKETKPTLPVYMILRLI